MYKKLLLPLDGSDTAEKSIPTATEFARLCNARITLMHVSGVYPLLKRDRESDSQALREHWEGYLGQVREKFEEQGVAVDIIVKMGEASLEICNYAEQENFDLIILSSHGAGVIKSWAIGSVSDKVLRHSTKPVLLLRPSTG